MSEDLVIRRILFPAMPSDIPESLQTYLRELERTLEDSLKGSMLLESTIEDGILGN